MNQQVFFIAFAIGTIVALISCWRYAHRGIHPRFRPHFGLVAVVFVGLMGAVSFIAFLLSHMVGNQVPSVRGNLPTAAPVTTPAP